MKHFNPNNSIQTADDFLVASQNFFERLGEIQRQDAANQRPDLYKKTYDPAYPSNKGFKSLDDKVYNKKQYPYEATRNSIPVASLGDKAYRHPTYAPGFFKEPGIYPGSSNCI